MNQTILNDGWTAAWGNAISIATRRPANYARDLTLRYPVTMLLSGDAVEKIEASVLDKVIVTNSIPLKTKSPKFEVVSIAPLLAEVIQSVLENTSIFSLYDVKTQKK